MSTKKTTLNKLEFGIILETLATHNVSEIHICYSGGGDSGAIDTTEVVFKESLEQENKRRKKKEPVIPDWDNMAKTIEDWAYERLEREDDWYNNDGGSGTIDIKVPSGRYKVHHGVNYMKTDYSDSVGNLKKELKDI